MKSKRGAVVIILLSLLITTAHSNQFDYPNYDQLSDELKNLEKQFPQVVSLESLEKTAGGRDLWMLKVGTNDANPAICIVAGVMGANVASGSVVTAFVRSLAKQVGKVDSVTAMLDSVTFYVFPRINPDASEQLWRSLKYERRLNTRELDLDHDGKVSEDGYDDLNGDGLITFVRVIDPLGTWIRDPHDSLLMREAEPEKGEHGEYKVFLEGWDNDKDGAINEDEKGGVDFNMNFVYEYPHFAPGAGEFPLSEIESHALSQFLFDHSNIAVVISFSRASNLITPWASAKREEGKPVSAVLSEDASYYKFISKQFSRIFGEDGISAPANGGNFAEWAYYHFGRWSFSLPAWTPPALDTTKTENENDPLQLQRRTLHWIRRANLKGAFVDWQPVEHPDFSGQRAEVGGFAPAVLMNPPLDSIEVIAAQFSDFVQQLAKKRPRLALQVDARSIDKHIVRVTAHVKNIGYLPTNSKLGELSKWVKKVRTEIVVQGGQKLLSGVKSYQAGQIKGGEAREYSWLLETGRSKVVVRSGSPTVGFVQKEVAIK